MDSIIDLQRYPLDETGARNYRRLLAASRTRMARDGALQLPGFLLGDCVTELRQQADRAKSGGHRMQGLFTAYSDNLGDAGDPTLAEDHAHRLRLPASHWFIAGDIISNDNPLRKLYRYPAFIDFLRRVLQVDELHPIADELGSINLLAYEPGDSNGWHFDTNEFVVSLVLQTAGSGGEYQYIPDLRSQDDANLGAISRRMRNPEATAGIHRAELSAGSLFLFKGKYSLHRVTRIEGSRDRIVAILSYHRQAGHRLSDSSKIAMYGRTA